MRHKYHEKFVDSSRDFQIESSGLNIIHSDVDKKIAIH